MRHLISLCLIIGLSAASAFAAAPEAKHLFPAGVARGAAVEIAVAGDMGAWPAQAWTSRPGVVVSAAMEKGKFSVSAAPEAVPGVCWVRIYNAEGAAAPLPLVVGALPEVNEQEPNDNLAKAQVLPSASCLVNGRLEKRGDVDLFAVSLTKGQTLMAAVAANETLGSPMDAVLQIVSPRGGVLAQSDDERGLDPLLPFTAPADGQYLARLFAFPAAGTSAISLAGGETFIYRLTLTTGGFVDGCLPLAVSRGAAATVEARGWNLTDADKRCAIAPPSEQSVVDLFEPRWANSFPLPVIDFRSLVEVEPNAPAQPQAMELPAAVSGLIAEPRDKDAYRFHLAKGQACQFKLESRSLGYPLDGVLELFDVAGKSLARVDDTGKNPDAELKYTAAAEGDYTLVISDLYEHGGPRFLYRLTMTPLAPDFTLSVGQHAYAASAGQRLEIPVTVDRRQGFDGEIDFQVAGLPEGASFAPIKSLAKGETAKTVKLVLTASTAPFSGPIRISGASAAPTVLSRTAEAPLAGRQETTPDLWLTIK